MIGQRHPDIALRAPEFISTARARTYNKPVIHKFHTKLRVIQETKNQAYNLSTRMCSPKLVTSLLQKPKIEFYKNSSVTGKEEPTMGSNPEELPILDLKQLQDFVTSRNGKPSPSPNPTNEKHSQFAVL
ncbi:hypothetical protein JTB14_010262 [Gonioctena quinquepunctata]|nr:hypothetical protein JTB14_010262 [Gonioctena quinquepunctata]